MTRLEAIRAIRSGKRLERIFTPETHGVTGQFLVMLYSPKDCDFPGEGARRRIAMADHIRIGSTHCLFFAGGAPHWLHLYPKQLLGFIRRNYPRT